MSDPGMPSLNEAGGIFAAVVALLAMVGGGIKWAVGIKERREETRSAKLDVWHKELTERERTIDRKIAEYHAERERQIEELKDQVAALRIAFELVAVPLRATDPAHPNLSKAEQILGAAFPLIPRIPPDMGNSLAQLD